MTVVEAPLTFLEVQVEGVFVDAFQSVEPHFGVAPERLDAVDVRTTTHELIVSMRHTEVFLEPEIHEAIVASPAVAVDDAPHVHTTPNHSLQRPFPGIGHNLRVDPAIPLEDPEDDRLPPCTTPTFATDAAGTEVRFVSFHLSTERSLMLTILCHAPSGEACVPVDRIAVEVRQPGDFRCLHIECKQPQKLSKFLLRNSGTAVILVLVLHGAERRISTFSQLVMSHGYSPAVKGSSEFLVKFLLNSRHWQ